jgi:hypothetical protein
MNQDEKLFCPHCGEKMDRWNSPPDSTWGGNVQYVCFNDECPYFVRGWKWMWEKYSANSSYRHRYDPNTGKKGPLPVWSKEALRENIIQEDEEGD